MLSHFTLHCIDGYLTDAIQVHEDLLDIKEKLMSNGQVDVSAIQNAIEKTESSIKVSTLKCLLHIISLANGCIV